MTQSLSRRPSQAPLLIRIWNPLTNRLLRLGVPMGPNTMITVRGRTSGEPRSAPVAIAPIEGRRYVIGAYGDVQWVRNLRAAGEADIQVSGGSEHVRATELDRAAATEFFGETLPRYIAHFPRLGRVFGRALFGAVAPEIFSDPALAAETRPVFELHAA
jgi:deazaflavin-dependent oxidoreductase (nitroreductase family)